MAVSSHINAERRFDICLTYLEQRSPRQRIQTCQFTDNVAVLGTFKTFNS